MPSTSPRFLVVDQSLKDFAGHHYAYSRAVIEAAIAAGFTAMLAPHQAFPQDALAGAPVVGRFSSAWNETARSFLRTSTRSLLATLPDSARHALLRATPMNRSDRTTVVAAAPRFADELSAIIVGASMCERDHTFIHTLGEAELLGLAERLQVGQSWPGTLHIILRYDGTAVSTRAFEMFERANGRLRFWTDTELLARHYRDLGGDAIGVLPIPHALRTLPAPIRRAEGPLTLASLGGARGDKGFDLLPALVEALAPDYLATGRARLLIQSNYSLSREEPLMAASRRRLARHPEWVQLINHTLDHDDFETTLFRTDILLLPYRTQTYLRRSSSLLIQAMVSGIPTVVPEGTWLAAEAPPGAHMAFGNKLTLEQAVCSAIDAYPALSDAARAAAVAARDGSTARKLVEVVLA